MTVESKVLSFSLGHSMLLAKIIQSLSEKVSVQVEILLLKQHMS